MRHTRLNTIESMAQSVNAGEFDVLRPAPHQTFVAGAIGAIAVLIVAAAFLAAVL